MPRGRAEQTEPRVYAGFGVRNGNWSAALSDGDVHAVLGDRLISGAHNPAAGEQLFNPVRRPANNPGDGEQRRAQLSRYTQHFIHKTGIQIHVGGNDLPVALDRCEYGGREALYRLNQLELFQESLFFRKRLRAALEHDRARVGQRVHGVAMP